tara:strand:+ start:1497 stop:1622 length:126 start_codon:yes stop_codon:yes gene_type:complete
MVEKNNLKVVDNKTLCTPGELKKLISFLKKKSIMMLYKIIM